MVKKIFNNYGSNSANINTVYLTLLNNETINSSSSIVDVDVLVTDDMRNEIFGKIVPVDLNDTRVGNVSITDGDVSIAVSNPGEGTYLVNGNYTGALNTIVKTGVITFLEPYTGPFYVATNGSDSNNGDVDHPFATIEQAIKAAAVSNNTHAIFINEGTYHEYDLSVPAGMNITGIGDVTIDADNKGRIMNVSGSNVNISNIKFSNGNFVSSSTSFAGALYWTGINGTLNNARFLNNNVVGNYSTASGGAVYWTGANGLINNTKFENSMANTTSSSYYAYGGAVYWAGDKGTLANSTFDNSTVTSIYSSRTYGGAVYWKGYHGRLLDNSFDNSNGYYGGTIYNYGYNLTLSGNEINNTNGTYGRYIATDFSYGSINGAVVTILNNTTVSSSLPSIKCTVNVTDDMGNPIYGGYINVTLNSTKVGSGQSNYDIVSVTINNSGEGQYLVVPHYYHYSAGAYNDNYTSKTGVINWG
ncbi:hypothetical protein [uncultured Methanobrevibacter sp.]|uniref:hypothetical protein n=1 Tax=uncultured Methanobrevibacter sp. TaxID=253161 RepID=UPI0025DEF676|nr:hypothetical protein [uncultured Methanobrevibacter sp.]